jgi:uncharacterized paraquat-inducible protein A
MPDPTQTQSLPCPNCQAQIYFSPAALLRGETIECPSCHTQIALAPEPRPNVNDAMGDAVEKLEALRRSASKAKREG